ncbi:MAG: protein kinase domain-containing protein [Acidimicrobiales bacterium]
MLGPIGALSRGANRIDLGGSRQRRLLAALAVDAGRVVPHDRLAERVWYDSSLPENPRASLRTLVTRLRSALGSDAVATEATGYRLVLRGPHGGRRPGGQLDFRSAGGVAHDADAGTVIELDSAIFDALLARADAADTGLADRLALLDRALSLWEGPAFDDVADEEWARAEAERLEELRVTTQERRFDALLESGKHTDALPSLTAAVETHPLRDRLVGLQMLALHRAGRQAEASRAFQAHRVRLAEELGLEPGADLVELDRRILAGDAGLQLAPGAVMGRALRGYRLGEQVGEGAFANVFRGTQPSVGRDVAVKVIRAELANQPHFVRRFEVEAHLVARLEHPHIVPLYDYWREPDRAFLVFRFLRGGTLESKLTASGPLPIERCRTLVSQIGTALAEAHRAGVVHRDVKPANIFLDEAGNFYLGDFGIALGEAQLADPTAALSAGSPAYASPEQLRRQPIGPPADVHGLGITLFEALTGRLPFPDALTYAELLQRQLHEPIGSVRGHRAELPAAMDDVLARATAKSPTDRYQRVEDLVSDFLAALDSTSLPGATLGSSRRGSATAVGPGRNPYKGLRAFTEADTADFKGRARLVDRLVAGLSRPGSSGRVAAVVGPSGIGKSSVVRAGLLPALRRGAVAGSDGWFVATMLPGRDPFEEVAAALLRVATSAPLNLIEQLTADERGLARVVKALLPEGSAGAVLLVIDQFEELFTLCRNDAVRRRFIGSLEHALADARCPLRVVLTMRADFYDRPLRYGTFARLIDSSTVAVTALAPDELEAAIVEPAAAVGCEFEPGLVSEIVADVSDQPGALPLLQYALTELYERRVSELLTRDAYHDIGGVAGALARRAEELAAAGTLAEQAVLRRVFGRLVTLGEGAEDTRRRVLRRDLGADEAVAVAVDRFGAARLLSFDRDPASREPTVEVAHEALIRQWPRLAQWLDEDRDALRTHRHLSDTARSWALAGRDEGELYRGARLAGAIDWRNAHPDDPNEVERYFLVASEAAANAARRREVRARRRLQRAFGAVAVVAVAALLAGALAVQQRGTARQAAGRAERSAFAAETGRLAALGPTLAETDLPLSMLIGVEANRRDPNAESLGALQRTFVAAGTSLGFVFSHEPLRGVFVDGRHIIGFGESTITRWDIETHERLDVIPLGSAVRDRNVLSWHPLSYASGHIAWVGTDDVARLMDLSQPTEVTILAADASDVALDSSGTRVALARRDGGVTLAVLASTGVATGWETPADGITTMGQSGLTLDLTAPIAAGILDLAVDTYLTQVAFSPDGTEVLHTRAGWLNWLDAATGARLDRTETVYFPNPDRVTNQFKVFDLDGPGGRAYLAGVNTVGAYDRVTRQASTRFVPPVQDQGGTAISDLATLADGSLAVLSVNGSLSVLDPDTGSVRLDAFDARVGQSSGLALLPDGAALAVAGDRGVALIATDGGGLLHAAVPYPGDVPILGASRDAGWINADARNLASRQTVPTRYWDCEGPDRCLPAERVPWVDNTLTHPEPWSNTWLRTFIGPPTSLQVLDEDGQPLSPVIELAIPDGFRDVTVVSRDRRWAMVSRRHVNSNTEPPGVIQVNALPSGQRIATIDSGPGVAFAVAADESVVLAFADGNGDNYLIDTATWTRRPTPLDLGAVVGAAYSPDGRWLVTTHTAGELVLRDPDTFAELRRMPSEAGSPVGAGFAFSDDGRYLVSTHDGKGRLWDLETGQLIGQPIAALPTVSPVAFPGRPPGLVTVDPTGRHIQIWRFDPPTWQDMACQAAGRNLTRKEWDQHGPRDVAYRATCPQWPIEA